MILQVSGNQWKSVSGTSGGEIRNIQKSDSGGNVLEQVENFSFIGGKTMNENTIKEDIRN